MEKLVITDVKAESNIAQIIVNGVKDEPGRILEVFRVLSKEGLNVDMILCPAARHGDTSPMFTITEDKAQETVDILMANRTKLEIESVELKRNMAKITLSGTGLMSHSDIVPRVLSCFHECNASTDAISTSEIAIKVFTDNKKAQKVLGKIRDEFEDYGL